MDRYTARLRVDYQAKKWLKFGANANYTHFRYNQIDDSGAGNSSGNVFAYTTAVGPIYPLYIRDGEGNVMYNEDGTFLKPNFFIRPAMHAFIDTEIIAKAPAQYMWAGIGDTYAKYYEATISSRGEQLEHFTSLGVALSVMCRNPLLEYGAKALEDHKKGLCTYDVEQVVLAIVVTTGIASIFLTKDFTPDYNSGLAHAIFYALTSYPVIEEKHLHGEVVGFGVLFALLVDQQYEEFEKIYTLNQQLQLPTSLEQIEITEEQWEESMDRIPEMSDIRHYPYKVTKEMLALAMNQLKEREGGRLINA